MTYLDNAATSFPKPKCVIREVNRCIKTYCGNPGRGSHSMSLKAAEEIYKARETVARHIGAEEIENIVFTPNATYALNLAIKTLIEPNCHVLCSDFEHNAVIRPLNRMARERGITYSLCNGFANFETKIQGDTKAIVCSIASNVTGEAVSIDELSKIAIRNNLKLIIDASQVVGHKKIELNKTHCDAFCAPGHKSLFGIQGSGFVYLNQLQRNESFIEGGSGFDSRSPDMPRLLPEAYEAGTLSTPSIVSLGRGIEYIESVGVDNINAHVSLLTTRLADMLSCHKEITLYGHGNGIVSFNVGELFSTDVSAFLNDKGICVRGGLHCAPAVHSRLGTLSQGTVRASFSYFNSKRDVDKLYRAIKEIIK